MDIEVARGAQVRARARWVEEGETSSALFLLLEEKRTADRSVAALRTTDPLYPIMMTCVVFFRPFISPYLLLPDENYAFPHCVENFRPTFSALYWPSTWRQFHFANFDRSVLDFSWKVAHGVVLTAQRLISFGLLVS